MMNSKTYFVNNKTYSVPTEPARDTVGAIMAGGAAAPGPDQRGD